MAQADFGQGKKQGVMALMLAGATLLGAAAPMVLTPTSVVAQNLFAPRLYVNGEVITQFELDQRAMFLRVLNAPGDLEAEALKALIDDKLRLAEGKRLGVKLDEAATTAAMEEFASRANLTADQLVAELAKGGISRETYRDFVTAGAVWREIVRGKFVGRVPISDAEVDRALDATSRSTALKVLVSELVIPLEPGKEQAGLDLAKNLSESISSEAGFASAAQQYSAASTGANGGRLPEWLSLSNLPPAIGGQLLALGPGDVTAPIQVPGAVVLFQLRNVAPDDTATPISVSVEWADFVVPDDATKIAHIRDTADRCLDLYGLASDLPPDVLRVTKAPLAEVPQDVALQLARLDLNEIATMPSQPGFKRLVMLCARQAVMETPPTREQVRERIINQKLEGMAENDLEVLRSTAVIRQP